MKSKYLAKANGKFLIMDKKEFCEYVDLYGGYSSACELKGDDLKLALDYVMDLKTSKMKLESFIKNNRLKLSDINKIWEQ